MLKLINLIKCKLGFHDWVMANRFNHHTEKYERREECWSCGLRKPT